ncbi:MAG: DUF262 domain-containing HNH endonuclease family protein [Aliarcobacter sp.]|nr:DUF262 domain-containing HNH endonuclease family protein [Aliarcobacter sp.]
MANELFHPEHLSLNNLFSENMNYVIPSYQRPYSWESLGKSDRNNQINNMWDDFFKFYSDTNSKNKEYFFGSIVVYKDDGISQVVDGQQRLTSLLLLFSAMKCFLEKYKDKLEQKSADQNSGFEKYISDALNTLNKLIFNEKGVSLRRVLKVKIERASGFNFDEILNKVIQCETKNNVLQNINEKYKEIAERYFDNREYFFKKLEETFIEDGLFTFQKADEFDAFGEFLRTKISVVVINTINFETAYNIFEVLNNRGLPLSAKDLFRNFIISEFDRAKENEPDKKWNALEESYEVTSEFLGRFVESYNGSQVQKSAFNEIQDYYNNMTVIGNNKIYDFYKLIDTNLNYYTMIVNEQNIEDKCIRNKVQFIKLLEHERYSINFLLTVFRFFKFDGTSNFQVLEFLTAYEKFRLYILLSPSKRFTSSPIYKSIRKLNENDTIVAIQEIQNATDNLELKQLIDSSIYDNYNAKLLVSKFLFSEYCSKDDVVEHELNFKKSTLEHILPQNPDKGTNWLNDFSESFREEWTYKLGNFTLLTHNMNSSAKNYDFTRKQKEYEKTILHITKELSSLSSIDEDYIKKRQHKIISAIYKDLGL